MPLLAFNYDIVVSGCHYLWSKRGLFLFTLLAIPNALRLILVFFPEMNRSIQIEGIFRTEIDDVVVFLIGVILAIECIISIVSFYHVCHPPIDAQFARSDILPTILSLASVAHAVWLNLLVWELWTEHFFTGVVYLQALPTLLLILHSFIQRDFVSCVNAARRTGGIRNEQQNHEFSRHVEAHGWFNVLLLLYTISMVAVAVKSDYKMSTSQQVLIGLFVMGDIINRSFSAHFLLGLKVQAVDVQPVEVQATEVQPVEVQAAEVQPVEVQAAEVQPVEVQAAEVQPVKVQAAEVQPVEVQAADVQPVEVQATDVQAQNDEREQSHFPVFFQYTPPLPPSDRRGNYLPFHVLCEPSYNNTDITSIEGQDKSETGDSAAMILEEESELGCFNFNSATVGLRQRKIPIPTQP